MIWRSWGLLTQRDQVEACGDILVLTNVHSDFSIKSLRGGLGLVGVSLGLFGERKSVAWTHEAAGGVAARPGALLAEARGSAP